MLPLDALRTLYSHAETTRGAAASGCISAVCQVRQARGTRVLGAVAWGGRGRQYWEGDYRGPGLWEVPCVSPEHSPDSLDCWLA